MKEKETGVHTIELYQTDRSKKLELIKTQYAATREEADKEGEAACKEEGMYYFTRSFR